MECNTLITVDGEITELWCEIYEAIRQAWLDYGFAPAQSEIQKACGCSAVSVVNAYKNLERKGYVTYKPYQGRSVKPTNLDRRLIRYELKPWETMDETKLWE